MIFIKYIFFLFSLPIECIDHKKTPLKRQIQISEQRLVSKWISVITINDVLLTTVLNFCHKNV